ncbi:MAG: class I SAM-dependent RNA methyltransferase [Firmicutes bacterium]|nr:class I SAM-dependent RNA methyltransferase [Bacillota bacterium]
MNEFEIVITTLFGLEAFCAREVKRLGYDDVKTEDGRVTFKGDMTAVARANMQIRTGERVFIKAGEFEALSFEELFDKTAALDWEGFIPKGAAFPVKGHTLKSRLASERDCQAIIKKAVAKRLQSVYNLSWMPEDGAVYQIQFSLLKDRVTLLIDTSGEPLHKRGYRRTANAAPLRETIAAAMVMMSYWKYEYPLCDPFCGSGTIPIEAVLFKENIAPGINRSFAYEKFFQTDSSVKTAALEEAKSLIRDIPLTIFASDKDRAAVDIAKTNAKNAGVDRYVNPRIADAADFMSAESYGCIICNPPYGERLGEKEDCYRLYSKIGKMFSRLDEWSLYALAADEDFERHFGKRADKRRKIYNGMIKCNIYQYFGAKPPKPAKTND